MSNSLPDVLKVQPLPSIDTMTIHTEVLDPITITDTQAVFQIPRTGILDGGSFLQLGATCAAGQNKCFFPLTTGVAAMIDSVQLKVGGQVVSSTEDFAHYHTLMRQFQTPEHRAEIGMVKEGACGDRFATNNGSAAANFGNGRIGYRDLAYNADGSAAEVPALCRLTSSDSTTPLYSLKLSQLIPMMKSRQLPLFAMKENVYLVINFNIQNSVATRGIVACFGDAEPATDAANTITPSKVNIKFVSDHLYYSDDTMNKTAAMIQSEGGLAFLYEDLILTTSQVEAVVAPAAGATTQQQVQREIAVSGRVVRSLYISDKPQAYRSKILGEYVSKPPTTETQVNYRINDQRIYDRPLQSPSRKYHELALAAGRPLMCPNQLYSFDADADKSTADFNLNQSSISNATIDLHAPVAGLGAGDGGTGLGTSDFRACSHYLGLDLSINGMNQLGNGRLVGVKPIELDLTYSRTQDDFAARTLRTYAMVERTASIKNGEIMISA